MWDGVGWSGVGKALTVPRKEGVWGGGLGALTKGFRGWGRGRLGGYLERRGFGGRLVGVWGGGLGEKGGFGFGEGEAGKGGGGPGQKLSLVLSNRSFYI